MHNEAQNVQQTAGESALRGGSSSSIVDFIRRYNRWRRGDQSLTMESPKAIGEALDAVCDRIETLERWVEEGKWNGARCAEERDRLQGAVREYRDAKGCYHAQKACERMIALLPENASVEATRGLKNERE